MIHLVSHPEAREFFLLYVLVVFHMCFAHEQLHSRKARAIDRVSIPWELPVRLTHFLAFQSLCKDLQQTLFWTLYARILCIELRGVIHSKLAVLYKVSGTRSRMNTTQSVQNEGVSSYPRVSLSPDLQKSTDSTSTS